MINLKIEIEIPDQYEEFFDFLEGNFGVKKKAYIEHIVKQEIESRNLDFKIF